MPKKRVLTGDRPTGKLHLGHYFGSLLNRIRLQSQQNDAKNYEYDQYIMIADMQALTDNAENSSKITQSVTELLLDYYSVGLISLDETNPQSTIFLQSAVPALSEITMYYMNLVTESRVVRNPTVKTEREQKKWQGGSVPFGFLAYPVSQAADITAFKADFVPVGADQLPMIELTNEIVEKFNNIYRPTLHRTSALLLSDDKLCRILGTDGVNKMSKSLNNAIFLSDDDTELWKKIKKMKTCTRNTIYDKGSLENNAVFYFFDILASLLDNDRTCYKTIKTREKQKPPPRTIGERLERSLELKEYETYQDKNTILTTDAISQLQKVKNNLHLWQNRYVTGGSPEIDSNLSARIANQSNDISGTIAVTTEFAWAKDSVLKNELYETMNAILAPIRKKRQEGELLLPDLYKTLYQNNQKANEVASETLKELKLAMGLDYSYIK